MSDTSPDINIDYVANLARIELTAEEKSRFSDQLGQIISYFDKLKAVDVEGIEPIAHAFPVYNVLDEDETTEGLTPAEALQNAPAQREQQVIVPTVVEDSGSS